MDEITKNNTKKITISLPAWIDEKDAQQEIVRNLRSQALLKRN